MPDTTRLRVNATLAADSHKTTTNPTIVDIANWADEFSHMPNGEGDFSQGYHYIAAKDDPPFECNVDLERDCSGTRGCVVWAIDNYVQQLRSPYTNSDQRAAALKFLVHFVADVTQPLHTEARGRGGNEIKVSWNGYPKTLHTVWDTDMITKLAGAGNYANMMAWTIAIRNEMLGGMYQNLVPQWVSCTDISDILGCATQWAAESNALGCSCVFKKDPEGKELNGEYYRSAETHIEMQIAKAGARLAVLLNQIFGAGQPGELPHAKERVIVQRRDL